MTRSRAWPLSHQRPVRRFALPAGRGTRIDAAHVMTLLLDGLHQHHVSVPRLCTMSVRCGLRTSKPYVPREEFEDVRMRPNAPTFGCCRVEAPCIAFRRRLIAVIEADDGEGDVVISLVARAI